MFKSMFDELKDVKYLKEVKESSKSRSILRTQARIYDGAFLWIYSTTYYFSNKSSIIDVRMGYV